MRPYLCYSGPRHWIDYNCSRDHETAELCGGGAAYAALFRAYECMYVDTYVFSLCVYACMCVCVCVWWWWGHCVRSIFSSLCYVCVYMCICGDGAACATLFKRKHAYIYIYIYIYVRMFACMYITACTHYMHMCLLVNIYIHTQHIYTHDQTYIYI